MSWTDDWVEKKDRQAENYYNRLVKKYRVTDAPGFKTFREQLQVSMPWLTQRIVFDVKQKGYDGSALLPGHIVLKKQTLDVLVNHPVDAAIDYIHFMAGHEAGHQANDQNYRKYNCFSGNFQAAGIWLDFWEGLAVTIKEKLSPELREQHSMMDRMDETCADMYGFTVALGEDVDRLDRALAWRNNMPSATLTGKIGDFVCRLAGISMQESESRSHPTWSRRREMMESHRTVDGAVVRILLMQNRYAKDKSYGRLQELKELFTGRGQTLTESVKAAVRPAGGDEREVTGKQMKIDACAPWAGRTQPLLERERCVPQQQRQAAERRAESTGQRRGR